MLFRSRNRGRFCSWSRPAPVQIWARILAIILGIVNLPLLPIGTAVGIYMLIIMFNQEAKALFNGEVTSAEMEEVS
jgi:hypothetical protein